MTAMLNRLKDSYDSIRSNLTPKKILVGIALAPVICYVASRAIARGRSYLEFYQNTRIEKIDCVLGKINDEITENFNELPKHSAIYQYCKAKELISDDSPESLFEAREELKEAFEKWLLISRRILCQPDMFPVKSKSPDYYLEFKHICCPDGTSAICPWNPRL